MPVKQSADDVEMPCELWVSKWPTSPFVQDCIAGNGSSGWPESCNAAGICANCRLQWFRAAYRWFKGILSAGSLATCQTQSVPGHSVGRMPCIGSRGPNECSEHVLHVAAQTSAFQNVRIVFEPSVRNSCLWRRQWPRPCGPVQCQHQGCSEGSPRPQDFWEWYSAGDNVVTWQNSQQQVLCWGRGFVIRLARVRDWIRAEQGTLRKG